LESASELAKRVLAAEPEKKEEVSEEAAAGSAALGPEPVEHSVYSVRASLRGKPPRNIPRQSTHP